MNKEAKKIIKYFQAGAGCLIAAGVLMCISAFWSGVEPIQAIAIGLAGVLLYARGVHKQLNYYIKCAGVRND